MYIYRDLGFRPIDAGDLEELRALHNDMSTLLQLGHVGLVSGDEQTAWWKALWRKHDAQRHTIVEVASGRIVGMLRIQNVDSVNRNCEIGLDIKPDLRCRGYGRRSYGMLLEYLFEHDNMHMVYLRAGAFNERALDLYRRLGFEETGRYAEFLFRHGRYWDYLIFSMTRARFDAARPTWNGST